MTDTWACSHEPHPPAGCTCYEYAKTRGLAFHGFEVRPCGCRVDSHHNCQKEG